MYYYAKGTHSFALQQLLARMEKLLVPMLIFASILALADLFANVGYSIKCFSANQTVLGSLYLLHTPFSVAGHTSVWLTIWLFIMIIKCKCRLHCTVIGYIVHVPPCR
jgi:hypothetical protein